MNTKVALVTGAARRIGAEITKTLHGAGFNIILHYHQSQQEAQILAAKLNELRQDSVQLLPADICDTAHITDFVADAFNCWGQLDLLVNNASCFYPTPFGQVTETQWDELHASNVKGAFFIAQAAYPHLQQTKGNIINIIDIHAKKPMREYSAYCVAKAGLLMATLSLAKEMAPSVRVNGVSPGSIIWPEGDNTLSANTKQHILERIPLARHGEAYDIAKTVLFLAESNFMTGEIISVDGGRSLHL